MVLMPFWSFLVGVGGLTLSSEHLSSGSSGLTSGPRAFCLVHASSQSFIRAFEGVIRSDDLFSKLVIHHLQPSQSDKQPSVMIQKKVLADYIRRGTPPSICFVSKHNRKNRFYFIYCAVKPTAHNLGVSISQGLNLDQHVNELVRSYFYQLRNIAKLSPVVTLLEMKTIISAFFSYCLDDCHSPLTGLSSSSLNRLQVGSYHSSTVFITLALSQR